MIEAAAQRAQATAEWLDMYDFVPQAELSQWVDVVSPRTCSILGSCPFTTCPYIHVWQVSLHQLPSKAGLWMLRGASQTVLQFRYTGRRMTQKGAQCL